MNKKSVVLCSVVCAFFWWFSQLCFFFESLSRSSLCFISFVCVCGFGHHVSLVVCVQDPFILTRGVREKKKKGGEKGPEEVVIRGGQGP